MQIEQKAQKKRESFILQKAEETILNNSFIRQLNTPLPFSSSPDSVTKLPQINKSEERKKYQYDLLQQIQEKKRREQMQKMKIRELELKEELKFQRQTQARNKSTNDGRQSRQIHEHTILNIIRPSRVSNYERVTTAKPDENSFVHETKAQLDELKRKIYDQQIFAKQQIDQLIDFARFNQSQANQYLEMQRKLKPMVENPHIQPLFQFLHDELKLKQKEQIHMGIRKEYDIEPERKTIPLQSDSNFIFLQEVPEQSLKSSMDNLLDF